MAETHSDTENRDRKLEKRGGVPMSLEAITSVNAAENEAKAAVQAAEAKAKQMLADADAAGQAAVEAAGAKADAELRELRRKAEEKYRIEAAEQAEVLEGRKAALRAQAGEKLGRAAALIVERIVNN